MTQCGRLVRMVKPSRSSLEVTAGMLELLQLHQVLTYRGNLHHDITTIEIFYFRITNDDREVEMEQNMQGVGSILGTLKNMATDMGDEIERQNKHLDLIQGKVKRLYFSFSTLFKNIFLYFRCHDSKIIR